MALVGLMNALKLEGAKYDIKVNTVAPLAASRLTEDVLPPDLFERMQPEFVAPIVLYLASQDCADSGAVFNAGMGYYNRAAVLTGPGTQLGSAETPPTPEDIHAAWGKINAMENAVEISDLNAALGAFMAPPLTAAAAGGADVQAIFDRMAAGFQAEPAAGLKVVFQFDIAGAGSWQCVVADGSCRITAGTPEKPACTLKIGDADFIAMMTGSLPPMQAFTSGKLQITGDVMKSQLIEKLFKLA
jgi:putative sterol carrier protein